MKKINVLEQKNFYLKIDDEDYISITDIIK